MTDERPLFQHPPWMVGIMLILGVMSLMIGLTIDPFWLVMGSPAILTLVVYLGVRVVLSLRLRRQPMVGAGGDPDAPPPRLDAGHHGRESGGPARDPEDTTTRSGA